MPEKVIVDTSVLIALEKINLLDVLCKIYDEIILPEAVISEFGTITIECYSTARVESPLVRLFIDNINIGKGESEAIAWAKETGMKLLLDDLKARKVAETLDLTITGTIGVLLKAEEMGIIDSAHAKAHELKEKGFYVSNELLDELSRKRK